jgi:uncharacterized protein
MLIALVVLAVMAVALYVVAWRRKDQSHIRGLKAAKGMFFSVFYLLLLAFLVSGLLEVAIPTEIIQTWMGSQSGLKGILLGSAVGILIPGGPYVSFPIIAAIFHAGAGLGTVVAMVTGWALLGLMLIPFELAIVSARFTVVRISTTLVIPPVAGVLAQYFFGTGF